MSALQCGPECVLTLNEEDEKALGWDNALQCFEVDRDKEAKVAESLLMSSGLAASEDDVSNFREFMQAEGFPRRG